MFDTIVNVINQIDKMVWGWWMILLLLGTHIFMTVRTGFIQRKIGKAIRTVCDKRSGRRRRGQSVRRSDHRTGVYHWHRKYYRCGNAVALGGPGAVFWCWITGVFGIATKYSESLIAVKYRVKTKDGRMQGGSHGMLWNAD